MTLREVVRGPGLAVLLVYTFVMVVGFTMVMPLVAVHFVDNLGMAAAAVGLALAVRQLTQQGLAVFGGALADRVGLRRMICLGVLMRAAGFASLAYASGPASLLVAMIISALGGALFEAPYQAAIAALTTPENRPRYYALSNLVSGVATTTGPLIGIALLSFDFKLVCLAAAGCFALNAAIVGFLPPLGGTADRRPIHHGFGLVFRHRRFMALTLLMMGYWFVAVQINISFPLMVERLTGSVNGVGAMFALSAAMTIVLQYPAIGMLERRLSASQILVVGTVIMSLGAGAIAFAFNLPTFLACIAVFAFGAILTRPTQQTLIASMADDTALGTFLGFSSLALAIGGGIGNVAGGWLIDMARLHGAPALPWGVFCAVGLVSAYGLHRLTRLPNAGGVVAP